jgi:hypothetical protein
MAAQAREDMMEVEGETDHLLQLQALGLLMRQNSVEADMEGDRQHRHQHQHQRGKVFRVVLGLVGGDCLEARDLCDRGGRLRLFLMILALHIAWCLERRRF